MEKIKKYVKKAIKTFNQKEMRILPGNIAFFFVLAIIPLVTILIVVASYFSISTDAIIRFIREIFPEDASGVIVDAIRANGLTNGIGIFNIITLVVASNGTYAIVTASNTLYKITDTDTLKDRIKSVIILFILLFLIVFLISVPIFGEKIISMIGSGKVVAKIHLIYKIIRWPITVFLIYFTLKVVYTFAPSMVIKSKSTTYGAIFTTIIWTLATAIFGYYLKNFANYSILYGNLSSIVILMMWLYIMSYVFVMGLSINASRLNEK